MRIESQGEKPHNNTKKKNVRSVVLFMFSFVNDHVNKKKVKRGIYIDGRAFSFAFLLLTTRGDVSISFLSQTSIVLCQCAVISFKLQGPQFRVISSNQHLLAVVLYTYDSLLDLITNVVQAFSLFLSIQPTVFYYIHFLK